MLPLCAVAQSDTAKVDSNLIRNVTLSEVVVRSDFDVARFLQRVKEDTSFYKAFRNLRVLQFTSLNDVRMLDRDQRVQASLYSKTRQTRANNCRQMQVLEEKTSGDYYDRNHQPNYYTAELYSSLFFTSGTVCGENNIVAGAERNVREKKGLEKHKEQLKMMFFNPGKKIPGIPFIGDKIDIFDPDVAKLYDFSVDIENLDGVDAYIFTISARKDLSSGERNDIVFDNITTWFHPKTMEIIARNYDLSYDTPVYDFRVHMQVKMTHFNGLLVPSLLVYNGNWKVAFKKRERGVFTATIFDFATGSN